MTAAHIVIEGPDGAGKTTLARALCEAGGYAYRHEGPPPASTTALRHYAGVLATLNKPTLLDRFHLGELVYAPLLRGQAGLSRSELRVLRHIITGLGIRIVLCLPPFEVAFENWSKRRAVGRELIDSAGTFKASYAMFRTLAGRAHHVHDYTADPDVSAYLRPLPVSRCSAEICDLLLQEIRNAA